MDNNPFLWDEQSSSAASVQDTSTAKSTPSNPFMWDASSPKQQEAPQQTSSFMAGIDAFNRQFERMAEGVLDLVTFGRVNQAVRDVHNSKEAQYAQTSLEHPMATTIGGVLGGIGSSVAYGALGAGIGMAVAPEAAAGLSALAAEHPLAAPIVAGTVAGTGMGLFDYADTPEDRFRKGLLGGTVGALAGAAGYGLGQLGRRWFQPRQEALKTLTTQVQADLGDNAAEKIPGLLQPAAALGDTRTPGQAIGGLTASKESQYRGSPEIQALARNYERQQSERTLQGVSDAIDKIAPAGTKEVRDKLYSQLSTAVLPEDALSSLKSNPVINNELNNLNLGTEVSSATRALPDNSVAKLNVVKQEIDDKLFRDARALDPTSKKGLEAIRALREARQQIVDTIDPIYPDYAAARQEAQKLVLRKRYDDLLLNKGAKAGKAGQLDVDETFQAMFPNKETQRVFVQDVADAGGDPKQAEDIITALEQLRNNPLKAIWKRPIEDPGVAVFYGNKIGFVQKLEEMLSGNRYKKALLDLTFNGNEWAPQVQAALNSPNKEQNLLNLMVKVTGRKATRAAGTQAGRGFLQNNNNN